MTIKEATLLIEAVNQITQYEKAHNTELWSTFYDFAEQMMPIVRAGTEALASDPVNPWETAYTVMDREIEKVFGIKIKEENDDE